MSEYRSAIVARNPDTASHRLTEPCDFRLHSNGFAICLCVAATLRSIVFRYDDTDVTVGALYALRLNLLKDFLIQCKQFGILLLLRKNSLQNLTVFI